MSAILDQLLLFVNSLPGAIAQGLIWGIMAIGVYITYKILDVADLTVDGTMCTGGAVFVMLSLGGVPWWLALIIATLAGVAAGLITGIFHTVMGIPAILAGILTQLSLYTINLEIMRGQGTVSILWREHYLLVVSGFVRRPPAFMDTIAGETTIVRFNPIFIVAIIVAVLIAVLYWFFGTERGSSLRATGANQNMSRAQGINTKVNTVIGLMLSNGLVALSSALLTQYQGSVTIDLGRGAIVIGLAAVIIGGVLFEKIFHNFALKLVGVVLGSIIYFIVYQMAVNIGLSTNFLKLLTALVVAVFLAIPYFKQKLKERPKRTTINRTEGGN